MNDKTAEDFLLCSPSPGDIGWVIHRHGVLYAREYGWNSQFEALVAEVAASFLQSHDPARERAWIAKRDNEILGSVFLTRGDNGNAKLRLLYVEPSARGQGIGQALVDACVRAARAAKYPGIALWTTSNLHSARRLYEAAGFRLESEQPFDTFGPALTGQHWYLDLQ